ncbi:hypothetical protein VTO42DRAFT_8606 [Malbranchea cinnamomea]
MPPKKATAASKAKANATTKSKAGASKKVGRPSKKEAAEKETNAKPKRATGKRVTKSTTAAAAKTRVNDTTTSRKRKLEVSEEVPLKKARVVKKPVVEKAPKPKVVINQAPTQRLNVYVCGEGGSGELGLGTARNAVDVKRPRLNPLLDADTVGVVQVAVGGMHCLALTHDNKILSWGVNDQGALGRDTAWEGGMKDIDAASDSGSDDGSDSGLNPREAIPTPIPSTAFPEGTVFVEVAAADSSSFALTDDGFVYGWGTFRSNDGILGFDPDHLIQTTPVLIPGLKKIKHIACGDNHVLALDDKGRVFAWGSGQQNQLGRRIIERTKLNGLQPREFGLPKGIVHIGCGAFHSFAVHKSGKVYSWGLNTYGQTGIPQDTTGESSAAVFHPAVVESLSDKEIVQVCGGSHHSLARTANGECLVWGRLDGFQTGLKIDTLSDDSVIRDDRGRPRILIKPTAVPEIKAAYVAAGADHSITVGEDGRLWSWGFSANYQTGQGTDDDIEVASVVENTAVRGKKLTWAGAGGQFSVFAGPATEAANGLVNGVNENK